MRTMIVLGVTICSVLGFVPSAHAHAWGATSRPRTAAPERCTSSELPAAAAYVRELFARLVAGNPEVFVGAYAPGRFCIDVIEEPKAYAKTRAEALQVSLSTGLLQRTRSQDEAAAILAHELAHATLQHLEWDFEHPSYRADAAHRAQKARVDAAHAALDVQNMAAHYAELAELTAYVAEEARRRDPVALAELVRRMQTDPAARAAYETLLRDTAATMVDPRAVSYLTLRDWEAEQQKLTEAWFEERRRLQSIEDEILGERHASFNWREQEADEVAWEFLTRAGFALDSLVRALRHTLTFTEPGLETCEAWIEAAQAGAKVVRPERGTGAHPRACWRLFHAALTMPRDHPQANAF